jgi:hypothetical protein
VEKKGRQAYAEFTTMADLLPFLTQHFIVLSFEEQPHYIQSWGWKNHIIIWYFKDIKFKRPCKVTQSLSTKLETSKIDVSGMITF